ncbi:PD-(D/E)XK nuclease family protein [Fuchsiella alkaliacetigena]|uniref:PD-(D/E)XK nuclease family protein n=1 Tax=Fuchsiella alkaliacetigena TaxID=957042 RepID=UPI00200AD4EC|nr:PD-(D/E)XK nuclease family protein [Fuchsiella alkaliacetigena]MCK8825248.1 PD-(D/E)XK nuclease family protein [Fuchsiella alkaliacetigena]
MAKKLIYSDVNPLEEISTDYYLNSSKELLCIAPYYQMKSTIRDKLLNSKAKQAVMINNIVSIDQMFRNLYYQVSDSYQIIANNQLQYLLREQLKAKEYNYFNTNSVDYLIEFINNVDSAGIDLRKVKVTPTVLKEIQQIYTDLKDTLDELGFITKWQSYQKLLEEVTSADFTYLYPSVKELFLDRLYIIRQVELELIIKLSNWVEETTILLDYHPEKEKLFGNLDLVVERLREEGFIAEDRTVDDNPLIKELFTNQIKDDKYKWEDHLENSLGIITATKPTQELNKVAQKCKELALRGVNLDKVAIAFSKPSQYLPHLARIFNNYNLPYNQQVGMPLISSPVIRALDELVDILAGDFDAKQLLAVVDNNFIDLNNQEPIINTLEDILKEVRFELTGVRLIDELKKQIEAIELEADQDKQIKKVLASIEGLLADIELTAKMSWIEFGKELSEVLEQINFGREVGLFENEKLLAAWEGLQDVIESLSRVFKQERSVKEWLQLLKEILASENYNLPASKGVKITGNLELRVGDYDYIFLAGMNYNQFPVLNQNPLNKYLPKLGVTKADEQIKSRYIFMNHLLAANSQTFISYAKSKGEEEPLPTPYLQELFRVVDQAEIESFESSTQEEFYSIKDLQKYLGASLSDRQSIILKDDYNCLEKLSKKFKLLHNRSCESLRAYQGRLTSEDNLSWLKNRFNDQYNYTAYFLESYLSCPFEFLFAEIFEISDLELPEEPHPMERGSFIHQVLEEFHQRAGFNQINEDNYKQAYQLLIEVIKENIEEHSLFNSNFYWQTEAQKYLQGEELGLVFEKFLENEKSPTLHRKITLDGFVVKETEWEFNSLELIAGYKFSGRIDRIDYNPKTECLGVIDYKSGKVSNKRLANNPIQIPLYLLAVEETFEGKVSFGSYYGLKPKDMIGHKKVVPSADIRKAEDLLENECYQADLEETKRLIKEAIEGIRNGYFILGEEDRSCNYCQCQLICRKEEV